MKLSLKWSLAGAGLKGERAGPADTLHLAVVERQETFSHSKDQEDPGENMNNSESNMNGEEHGKEQEQTKEEEQ